MNRSRIVRTTILTLFIIATGIVAHYRLRRYIELTPGSILFAVVAFGMIASIALAPFLLFRFLIALVRREPHGHWSKWYFTAVPLGLVGVPTLFMGGFLLLLVSAALEANAVRLLMKGPPGIEVVADATTALGVAWEQAWPPEPERPSAEVLTLVKTRRIGQTDTQDCRNQILSMATATGVALMFVGDEAGPGCFVAGTPVQMADGSTKPIEKIKIGDAVVSRNATTGKTEPKRVVSTIVHYHISTIALTFANGEHIVTTAPHPLYVKGKGFMPAGQLAVGNAIVTRAGPPATIKRIVRTGAKTVYNLTVAGDHTYFVGTRDGGVWVHNACPPNLAEVMKDAALKARQDEVNGPLIDRYVDLLNAGSEAPPIQVEEGSNIIIDGHNRYVAGMIQGRLPEIEWIPQGNVPRPSVPWDQVYVDMAPPFGFR